MVVKYCSEVMNTEDIKMLWCRLPLSVDNDFDVLDAQIGKNPKAWQAVAEFLLTAEFTTLPLGRNEIGEGCFANVQEYKTKLQSVYELHRRYIDVQLLVAGEEVIFVAPKEQAMEPQGEFDVENDFILYASAQSARQRKVSPAAYQILYPSDAHMPCMAIDGRPEEVRKICVKIPYM